MTRVGFFRLLLVLLSLFAAVLSRAAWTSAPPGSAALNTTISVGASGYAFNPGDYSATMLVLWWQNPSGAWSNTVLNGNAMGAYLSGSQYINLNAVGDWNFQATLVYPAYTPAANASPYGSLVAGQSTTNVPKLDQSSVSISPSNPTVTVGSSVTFTASGGGVGGYGWSGAASGGGGSTTVTFNSVGSSAVYVQSPGDATYNASNTAGTSITIVKANQSISYSPEPPASYTYQQVYTMPVSASSGLQVALAQVGGTGSATTSFNQVTFTGAGSVVIRASQAGNGTYNAAATVDRTFTVNPLAVTFSLSPASYVYNGAARSPTVVPSVGGATFTTGGTLSATNVGSYTGTATATGNFSGSNTNLAWSITPATQSAPTITSSSSATYGTAYTATASLGGSGNSTITWSLGTGSTASGAAIHPTTGVITANSTGTVVIKAQRDGGGNYSASGWTTDFPVTVGTRAITITRGGSKAYDGGTTATGATGTVTAGSLAAGDSLANAFGATTSANVGGYAVTVTPTITNGTAPTTRTANYAITYAGTYAITAAPVTFSLSPATYVYNGSARSPSVVPSVGGATFTTGGTLSATNVGGYTGTAAATGNYSGSNSSLGWSITAATQGTVTVSSPATVTYGSAASGTASGGSGTGAYEWALGTGSTAPGAAVSAGGAITATGTGTVVIKARRLADANYLVSAWSADFTVTVGARPITVTLAGSKLFDGTRTPSGASASITAGSLASGDSIGYAFANTSSELPATYSGLTTATITNATAPTTRTGSYAITYAGSFLIQQNPINQAVVSVTSPATIVYGTAASGVASGGSGTGAYEWALGTGSTAPGAAISAVGAITATGTGTVVVKVKRLADSNYFVSAWSADFSVTINPRPISVILTGAKYYNGTTTGTGSMVLPASGTLAPGDAFAPYVTSSANAGTYTGGVVVTNATAPTTRTASYTITVMGSYTIMRTPVTAATIAALTYTGSPQAPVSAASTTPGGATVTVSAPVQTDAGTYATATVTGTGNYTGTLTSVAWTINRAVPSGTFATRRLGTQNPTDYTVQAGDLNASFSGPSGAPAPAGTPTYSIATGSPTGTSGAAVAAGTVLPVGTYWIRASYAQDANYAASSVDATWTVTLDADEDGVPGYIEVQIGTDPNVPNPAETSPSNPTGLKLQRPKS